MVAIGTRRAFMIDASPAMAGLAPVAAALAAVGVQGEAIVDQAARLQYLDSPAAPAAGATCKQNDKAFDSACSSPAQSNNMRPAAAAGSVAVRE
jgi:hypothetical protein